MVLALGLLGVGLQATSLMVIGAAGIMFCLADWVLQSAMQTFQSNPQRLLAGALGGLGLAFCFTSLLGMLVQF